jgi:hypothetical protein
VHCGALCWSWATPTRPAGAENRLEVRFHGRVLPLARQCRLVMLHGPKNVAVLHIGWWNPVASTASLAPPDCQCCPPACPIGHPAVPLSMCIVCDCRAQSNSNSAETLLIQGGMWQDCGSGRKWEVRSEKYEVRTTKYELGGALAKPTTSYFVLLTSYFR